MAKQIPKKIAEAILTIKEYCVDDNRDCFDCALRKDEDYGIVGYPCKLAQPISIWPEVTSEQTWFID